MDTFGAGGNCPFKSDVHLLESQIKGETKAGTNHRKRVNCNHIQITEKYFWLGRMKW